MVVMLIITTVVWVMVVLLLMMMALVDRYIFMTRLVMMGVMILTQVLPLQLITRVNKSSTVNKTDKQMQLTRLIVAFLSICSG